MGTEYWLADKDEEVKFYMGKLGPEHIFDSYVESAKKLIDKIKEARNFKNKIWNDRFDFRDTQIQDITIEQLTFLIECKNFIEDLPDLDRNLTPFIYFIEEIKREDHEWDYYSEYDEEKIEEYEDYKTLCYPFDLSEDC